MIEVNQLSKHYGSFCALENVSFSIAKGEVVGLLGPNGAGKSTILRLLTGYLRPTRGDVRVEHLDFAQDPVAVKNRLGYLPESAPLYPEMLTYDYLMYVAAMRRVPAGRRQQRLQEVMQTCGLAEVMHRPIGHLSKGYRQRVGLAASMIADPEILILDEPTTGLDPNQIVEIRDIIRRIGEHKTVILSTHILSEVEATCDRALIIHQGRIIADGAVTELKQAYAGGHIYVELADNGEEPLQPLLADLPGVKQVDAKPTQEGLQLIVQTEKGADLRPQIYQAIKEGPWTLLAFGQHHHTLEDVFQQLTQQEQ